MFDWLWNLFSSREANIHEACEQLRTKYVGVHRIRSFQAQPAWGTIVMTVDGIEFEDPDNQFWSTLFTDPLFYPHFVLDYQFTRFSPAGLLCCEKDLRELILLINRNRKKAGWETLDEDYRLTLTAFSHARWMKENVSLTHRNELSLQARIREHGFELGVNCGEVIAVGFPSVKTVLEAWNSERSCRWNILFSSYDKIGVGYSELENGIGFWCVIFASSATSVGTYAGQFFFGEGEFITTPRGIIAMEEFYAEPNLYERLVRSRKESEV